jgi:hypothetical protein
MNSRQMSLLLFTLMLFPTQSESKRTPTTATGEQSGFNYELEIDPIQKPVALPTEALLVLAKDKHVGSCLSSQGLTPEKLPGNWFVASVIHLDGPIELDLIALPAGRLPETPGGKISANVCLIGPNTGGFWVLRRTPTGFQLVLSQMAHSLEILNTRSNGLRDIRLTRLPCASTQLRIISLAGVSTISLGRKQGPMAKAWVFPAPQPCIHPFFALLQSKTPRG